MHGTTMKIEYL